MRISDWSSDVCSSDLLGKGYGLCGGADELDLIPDDENRGVWFDRRAGCVEQVAAGDQIAGHGDYTPMVRLSEYAAGTRGIGRWRWLVSICGGNSPGCSDFPAHISSGRRIVVLPPPW